jgi:hypothetical protein
MAILNCGLADATHQEILDPDQCQGSVVAKTIIMGSGDVS